MKTRVLIIPESYPTNLHAVAGIFIQDQIKALRAHCEVAVFNTNLWYRGDYLEVDEVPFYDFHLVAKKPPSLLKPLLYSLWEKQCLKLAKRIPKPDIIHLHGASLRGNWVVKLAKFWNVPLVITEHTGPWSAISNRSVLFERVKKNFEAAAEVWPVSQHLKQEMSDSGVSLKNIHVLPNPVDTEVFSLRNAPLGANPQILFVGRLDDFKGGLRTLKAFHSVMEQIPQFKLHIAGEGQESEAIAEYIRTHALEDRVHFTDRFLTRSEMKTAFDQSSFLVFPSTFESFGLVGIEAMSTGLPLIVTNQTGPRDYYQPFCGIQVNPDSVEQMANAMVELAQNIEHYNSEQIRNHVQQGFSTEAYGREVAKRYAAILSA